MKKYSLRIIAIALFACYSSLSIAQSSSVKIGKIVDSESQISQISMRITSDYSLNEINERLVPYEKWFASEIEQKGKDFALTLTNKGTEEEFVRITFRFFTSIGVDKIRMNDESFTAEEFTKNLLK